MKIQQLFTVIALCMTAASGNAAVAVTQFVGFSDGNDGGTLSALVGFDIVNTNSIMIATIYVDTATPAPLISNVRFGNGGGIGSGDVAPTLILTDSRLLSYVFINPSTASGLSFRADNSGTVGIAAALYEVSGANTDISSITTATNSATITTATAGELVVSFAGRNGGNPGLGSPTIFTVADIDISTAAGTVTGTGTVWSASATASTMGSQNITWGTTTGRIAYAFEAAAVPEPSSAFLGGLGLLVLLRRRR